MGRSLVASPLVVALGVASVARLVAPPSVMALVVASVANVVALQAAPS